MSVCASSIHAEPLKLDHKTIYILGHCHQGDAINMSIWPHSFLYIKKPEIVLLPETELSCRPKTLACRQFHDYVGHKTAHRAGLSLVFIRYQHICRIIKSSVSLVSIKYILPVH